MKRLIIASVVAASLAGCAATGDRHQKAAAPAPIPVAAPVVPKDQTLPIAGKGEGQITIDIPQWYLKPPAATDDYIYFSGTGYSSDLAMSREKALLDSQVKLADTINGAMNAMIKQQKSDNAGSLINDKTSVTVKKIIANTILTGYRIEDTKIVGENRSYRTFVLVRYPIGTTNTLLKERLQRESQHDDSDQTLQDELAREVAPKLPVAKTPVAAAEQKNDSLIPSGLALTE